MQAVIFRVVIGVAGTALIAIAANAQTAQPHHPPPASPASDAFTTGYQLGMQTGQQVTAALIEADARLKYVLDNWVPAQPEKTK